MNTKYNDYISEITTHLKNKDLIIFAGSAISLFAPSILPTGNQLRNEIICAISKGDPVLEKHTKRIINQNLNPELVYQTIYDGISDYIFNSHLMLKLNESKPNSNHHLIAKLATKKYLKTIVTTNFDLLIEKALDDSGLSKNKDYYVYADEEGFAKFLNNNNTDKISIIKLHGSIDDKNSMIVTLHQTGKGLSLNQANILDKLFIDNYILFLGYSGNDIDNFPKFLNLSQKAKGIFWNFRYEKEISKDISRLLKAYDKKGKLIISDLRDVFNDIAIKFNFNYPIPEIHKDSSKSQIKDHMNRWAEPIDQGTIFLIISSLLEHIGEYKAGIECNNQLLQLSKIIDCRDDFDPSPIYNNLGSLYRKCNNFKESLRNFEKSRKLYEQNNDEKGLGQLFSNIGNIYIDINEWDNALEYYNRSCQIKEKINDSNGLINIYNSLGIVYRRKGAFKEALSYFEKCSLLSIKNGDMLHLAGAYLNIGELYQNKRYFNEAIDFYKKSSEIIDKIGHNESLAQIYNNIGVICRQSGQLNTALEYYTKSLIIREKLNNKLQLAETLTNIGSLYGMLGQVENALNSFIDSYNIFSRAGDDYRLAGVSRNLGLIYFRLNEFKKAHEYFKISINIYEKVNDKGNLATVLNDIGVISAQNNKLNEAYKYFKDSLKIRESIGNKNALIDSYNNLCMLFKQKGDNQKVKEYYQKCQEIMNES